MYRIFYFLAPCTFHHALYNASALLTPTLHCYTFTFTSAISLPLYFPHLDLAGCEWGATYS